MTLKYQQISVFENDQYYPSGKAVFLLTGRHRKLLIGLNMESAVENEQTKETPFQ